MTAESDRQKIMEAFGVTEADLAGFAERYRGYGAARAEASRWEAAFVKRVAGQVAKHEAELAELLSNVTGKKIVGASQQPNEIELDGHWRDDPPLVVKFDDGSVLEVRAGGWHDSGGLYWEYEEPAES